jgi:uncharacterized protein
VPAVAPLSHPAIEGLFAGMIFRTTKREVVDVPSQAEPVSASERILTLDMIRGFALLGIFIMNMPGFSTSLFSGYDGSHLWVAWWDRTAETARDVVFSGKFNSMFSMLFAIGFTIQLERLEQRDPVHANITYLRRIFWLFVFGAIHACIFWTGDVLHMYALFGLVLMALRRVPDKVLWALFGACILYPVVAGIYRMLTTTDQDIEAMIASGAIWEASNNIAYGTGSFRDAAREHIREMYHLYTSQFERIGMISFYVQIFSTMMVGLILGRNHFFQNIREHLPQVKRVQWWGLALGVVTASVYGLWEVTVIDPARPTLFRLCANTCYYIGRVCIMAFYVCTIIRAVCNDSLRVKLMPIAIAGRMPLTNYLLQTAIATFVFYGWGLGLWGKIGPALEIALAIGIFFLIQVPLSYFWLKRFAMGPMEYVWRLLTYGHASMKRKEVVSAAPA